MFRMFRPRIGFVGMLVIALVAWVVIVRPLFIWIEQTFWWMAP
jgi:hypothetical protein